MPESVRTVFITSRHPCPAAGATLLYLPPDIQTMSTLQSMVDSAITGGTIKLPSDIEEAVTVPTGKALVFDLDSHTWSAPDGATPLTINDGAFARLLNGRMRSVDQPCIRVGLKNSATMAEAVLESSLELFGSAHSCVFLGRYGHLDTSADMTATNAAFCVAGNGSEPYFDSSCIVRGGTLKASDDAKHQSVAIYWPQRGNLYIKGGNISGDTGVEVRSGEVVITGGSIKATGTYSLTANGSGSTTTGVALAICQHSTKLPIVCRITGGIFNGEKAFLEANPQNNSVEAVDQIDLSISGGNFQGAIESVDCTGFIEGGTFAVNAVDPSYLIAGIQYTYNGNVITYYVDPSSKVHLIRSDLSVDGVVSSTSQGVLIGTVRTLPPSAEIDTVLYSSQDKQYHRWDGRAWVVEDMAIADDALIPGSTRPVQTGVVEEMREDLQAKIDNRYTVQEVDSRLALKQDVVKGAATTILQQDLAHGMILQSDSVGKVAASTYPITSLSALENFDTTAGPIQTQLDNIKESMGAKPLVFTDRTCEWFNSDDPEYPHKGVVNLPGVTEKDYAQVMFSRSDMVSGRFAPDCETAYGQLYIWSKTSAAVNIPLIVVTKG